MAKQNSILIRVHPEFAKLLKEMSKDLDSVTKTKKIARQLRGYKFETQLSTQKSKKKGRTDFII